MISIDWEINVGRFVRNKNQDIFSSLWQIFLNIDYASKLCAMHRVEKVFKTQFPPVKSSYIQLGKQTHKSVTIMQCDKPYLKSMYEVPRGQ